MGRKAKEEGMKSFVVCTSVPENIRGILNSIAETEERSISNVILRLIKTALTKEGLL